MTAVLVVLAGAGLVYHGMPSKSAPHQPTQQARQEEKRPDTVPAPEQRPVAPAPAPAPQLPPQPVPDPIPAPLPQQVAPPAPASEPQPATPEDSQATPNDRKKKYTHFGCWNDPKTLRVVAVQADGPAAKAGIRTGDRLLGVEGRKFTSYSDFTASVRERSPGDSYCAMVLRNGRTIELTVILGSRDTAEVPPYYAPNGSSR